MGRHGEIDLPLRLPELRRDQSEMGRALRKLRRVEHASSRKRSSGPARRRRRRPAGAWNSSAWPAARTAAARADRHRRTGPRAGRWSRAGLGGAGRRRSRDRQVDADAAGRRRRWRGPDGASCTSPARNRSSRCACAPAGWASPTRRLELAAAINLRDIAASLEAARDAALVVIDSIQTMWLDTIDSAPGTVPRCAPPASS